MPGPPLSKTFTYTGTPVDKNIGYDKFNTLDREMIQTQRFFISKDTGTHSKEAVRKDIVRNSGAGQGAGGSHITSSE